MMQDRSTMSRKRNALQLHSAPTHWTLPHILLDKLCHVAKRIANGVRKYALPTEKLQQGHGIITKTAIYIDCIGNLLKWILCKLLIWIYNFDESLCGKKYENNCKEGTNMMNFHERQRILYLKMTTPEQQRVVTACDSFSLSNAWRKKCDLHFTGKLYGRFEFFL